MARGAKKKNKKNKTKTKDLRDLRHMITDVKAQNMKKKKKETSSGDEQESSQREESMMTEESGDQVDTEESTVKPDDGENIPANNMPNTDEEPDKEVDPVVTEAQNTGLDNIEVCVFTWTKGEEDSVSRALQYFQSVASEIQKDLRNLMQGNERLRQQILDAMENAGIIKQAYDLDMDKYIGDLVDEDEKDTMDESYLTSTEDQLRDDLFKSQLISEFRILLNAFEKSWKLDFLNCYVEKIAGSEERVKAMLLCPQIERVYLQKYRTVLTSVLENPVVPVDALKRIYDRLELSLHYTDERKIVQSQEESERQKQEARELYTQERHRHLQTYPELEPFVKTMQQVQSELSTLDGYDNQDHTIHDSRFKISAQDIPHGIDQTPGIRDLLFQAQRHQGGGQSEMYRLFDEHEDVTPRNDENDDQYKQENTPRPQALSRDVEMFFRQYQDLYNLNQEYTSRKNYLNQDASPPSSAKDHLSVPNTPRYTLIASPDHTRDYHHHGTPRIMGKLIGPTSKLDTLKRKNKYATKFIVNKRKLSKDKKIPIKILTRGKTLEDFIYECNHPKTEVPKRETESKAESRKRNTSESQSDEKQEELGSRRSSQNSRPTSKKLPKSSTRDWSSRLNLSRPSTSDQHRAKAHTASRKRSTLHKSDIMKQALNVAYQSREFNFAAVRDTLKRYRLYREEKIPDLQMCMEQLLAGLGPCEEFKYNINHFV